MRVKRELLAVDLCCGAGGWACAARGLPIRFVAAADVDRIPLQSWALNHLDQNPGCQVLETDLSTAAGCRAVADACRDWEIDLVVGGIPCEQISRMRMQCKPTAEEIGSLHNLIDGCLDLVAELGPRWWAIEDVPQIEDHLPAPLFFGRDVPMRQIEASLFGPQERRRTFLGRFPEPTPDPAEPRTLGECLDRGPYRTVEDLHLCKAIANRSVRAEPNGRIRLDNNPHDAPLRTVLCTVGTSRGRRAALRFCVDGPRGKRLLTWQEAARVQGFPDDFVFVGSATAVSSQVGRAIPIQVGRAILRAVVAEFRSLIPNP
jgi:site-specific DNA-cytosine methylase